VWSICRRHELSDADAADINQSVWLQLISQLDQIGDPAAAGYLPDAQAIPDQHAEMAEQELLTAGRHAALRGAPGRLPPRCQQLIGMLIEDPPVPDAQISATLSIPVGSIAPRPRRCLDKLRGDPEIAALINTEGRVRERRTARHGPPGRSRPDDPLAGYRRPPMIKRRPRETGPEPGILRHSAMANTPSARSSYSAARCRSGVDAHSVTSAGQRHRK
jgi:hypothetical protein